MVFELSNPCGVLELALFTSTRNPQRYHVQLKCQTHFISMLRVRRFDLRSKNDCIRT